MLFEEPASAYAWRCTALISVATFLVLFLLQTSCSRYGRCRRRRRHRRAVAARRKAVPKRPLRRGRRGKGAKFLEGATAAFRALRRVFSSGEYEYYYDGDSAGDYALGGSSQQPLYEQVGTGGVGLDPAGGQRVEDWSPERVREWVEDLRLKHVPREECRVYAELFLHQRVSGYALRVGGWTAADVSKVGVPLGPSILIAERIRALLLADDAGALDDADAAANDDDDVDDHDRDRDRNDIRDEDGDYRGAGASGGDLTAYHDRRSGDESGGIELTAQSSM